MLEKTKAARITLRVSERGLNGVLQDYDAVSRIWFEIRGGHSVRYRVERAWRRPLTARAH